MIKQINEENIGIDIIDNLPGYSHIDALGFIVRGKPSDVYHSTYEKLSETILNNFPDAKYILELGSGAGSLSCHMRNKKSNIIVVTLDGNKESVLSPYIKKDNHFIVRTDVDFTLMENDKIILFDLIVSFEHFEHIQESCFGVFINNIKKTFS